MISPDPDRSIAPWAQGSWPEDPIDPYMADLFFSESEEMVQSLERDLVALEGESGAGVARRFRGLLRSAHSLKGSAGMYEMGRVAQGAHQLEESLTCCQSRWSEGGAEDRQGWLAQWLRVVDGLAQVLHTCRSGGESEQQRAEQKLQAAIADLPVSSGSKSDPQDAGVARSGMPSLQQTILSVELPPLIEALVTISGTATDPESTRQAIPELLEQLQTLNGVAEMLRLDPLKAPIEAMETLTIQALITDEGIEALPHLWTEQLIALEEARLAALDRSSEPGSVGDRDEDRESAAELSADLTDPLEDLQFQQRPQQHSQQPVAPEPIYRGELGLVSKVDARRVNTVVTLVEELVIQRTVLDHQRQELSRLTRGAKRILKGMRQSRQQLRRSTDHLDLNRAGAIQRDSEDLDGLEWDRYSQLHEAAYDLIEHSALLQETIEDLAQLERGFDQVGDQLGRLCGELSEQSSRLRMTPFSQVVDPLPRAIRELSQAHGKPVDLVLYGRNVELDGQVLSQLRDPLFHLVRNAFDHGIEAAEERQAAGKPPTGQIEIEARHQGSSTLITIRDDGRGIDGEGIRRKAVQLGYCSWEQAQGLAEAELYRFLFKPGFSTRSTVSQISGRGMGLDIVEAVVTQLQGQIGVQSQPGRGTIFTLRLPLMLSIVPALMVRADRDVVAIPQEQILQILRVPIALGMEPTIEWEERRLPLVKLPELLTYQVPPSEIPWSNPLTVEKFRLPVLILQNLQGEVIAGLAVDQLLGHQEIVLKPLPRLLPKPTGIRGAAVLGTGQVIMVLDTEELIVQRNTGDPGGSRPLLAPEFPPRSQTDPGDIRSSAGGFATRGRVLVVDDSYSVRQMLAMTLKRQGYQVDQAQDGQAAISQLAADGTYQLIITDLEMPRLDGFGLLRHLQTQPQLAQIPAVVLTSRSAEKHRERARSLQAAAYLTKPFRRQDLLQVLELLLPHSTAR